MNNACFGKFIENQRNRINFRLVSNKKKLDKLVRSPFFKKSIIFKENLVGIHQYKKSQKLDRPIHVGATILELARLHMYRFYYDELPKIFNNIPYELLYMDTDSFILSVETPDIYPYLEKNSTYFDNSDYPQTHRLHSLTNKKVPGKFKDEMPGKQIHKFISICPKVYALKVDDSEVKKIKGVQRNIVKGEITFSNFEDCLFKNKTLLKTQTHFRTKKHNILTVKQTKLALQLAETKRVWEDDNITSHAYGYLGNVISSTNPLPPPPSPPTLPSSQQSPSFSSSLIP